MMMNTSAKLYPLPFGNVKSYLFALLFVAGNILLPQLCHLLPLGGPTLLPIYFFTLVAAYKFGLRVGLLTAVLSPVVNHLLFAMPAAAVLPAILLKSTLLAVAASIVAQGAVRRPARRRTGLSGCWHKLRVAALRRLPPGCTRFPNRRTGHAAPVAGRLLGAPCPSPQIRGPERSRF